MTELQSSFAIATLFVLHLDFLGLNVRTELSFFCGVDTEFQSQSEIRVSLLNMQLVEGDAKGEPNENGNLKTILKFNGGIPLCHFSFFLIQISMSCRNYLTPTLCYV